MSLRKLTLCLSFAVVAAFPALSQAVVYVQAPPPAPQVEVVPPPRAGWVWAPGYWRWNGYRHVWVRGHWVREMRGRHWVPDHWAQAPNGRWYFVGGHWGR